MQVHQRRDCLLRYHHRKINDPDGPYCRRTFSLMLWLKGSVWLAKPAFARVSVGIDGARMGLKMSLLSC